MNQLLSVIIFAIPGLLVYFWIQAFGLNPTKKHSTTELAGITAIFWMPTVALTLLSYNRIATIQTIWLHLTPIHKLSAIESDAFDFDFLLWYFGLSAIFSLLISLAWSFIGFSVVLWFINKVRILRKVTKLDRTTSVWEAFFNTIQKREEEPMVVEMYKIDNPDQKIVGSITRMSRPFESERALVIEESDNWTAHHKRYRYAVKKSYIDTKSGMIVSELEQDTAYKDPFTASADSEEPLDET